MDASVPAPSDTQVMLHQSGQSNWRAIANLKVVETQLAPGGLARGRQADARLESSVMRFVIVEARTHRPDEYSDVFDGYKAVQLVDGADRIQGELVWRLATGNTVEITELGVFDESLRRKGWGTKLLDAGLESIRSFFADRAYRLRRLYVFCDAINDPARAFYEAHGFELKCVIPGLYHYCDAALYVLDLEESSQAQGRA